MEKAQCVEANVGGKQFKIESGWLAKQANGSALVSLGGTVVLAAVVCGNKKEGNSGDDMLPLTVDYREKTSAAGKFPGGFIKREGRPTTKEILTARLIDRPIRPLFPDGFSNELLVSVVVLSADQENDSDILAMNATSAALMVSDIPFGGPIGSVRVGLLGDKFVVNPTNSELKESRLDLVISGNKDGIIMVEAGANEVPEDKMLEAIMFAHTHIKQIVDLQLELKKNCGKPTAEFELYKEPEGLYDKTNKKYSGEMKKVFFTTGKKARSEALHKVLDKMIEELCPKNDKGELVNPSPTEGDVTRIFYKLETEIVRFYALEGRRADSRGAKDIRPISIQLGLLPRTHGSALFTRGDTQAIVTVTLGTKSDEQIVDGLEEEHSKRFMLHYNFPSFSVGEIKRPMGPGRREIGHGALAERALEPMIPSEEDFPYTMRVVSDILESNGSSSMATVCGGSLALMDAGVKTKSPVAGIAMGLIKEGGKYCILSDILGSEDKHGDMDFKVAGTEKGVTALQMDLKTTSISFDIMREALQQAKEGRLFVLKKMSEAITSPRTDLSEYAPRLERLVIAQDKIGLLIGPGGKTVREIQTKTGVIIEIEDDGTVTLASKDAQKLAEAKNMVNALTEDLKVGNIYKAKVVSIKDFGAFVAVDGSGQEGLVHISELADGFIEKVEDAVKMRQEVEVKVVAIDEQGRPRLSIKAAARERAGLPPLVPSTPPQRNNAGGNRFNDRRR